MNWLYLFFLGRTRYLVAVADVVPQHSTRGRRGKASFDNLKDISRRKSLHLLPQRCHVCLVHLRSGSDSSLQTAHEWQRRSRQLSSYFLTFSDWSVGGTRVALNVQDIHDCKFPAFYVLDSAVDAADRSAAQSICKNASPWLRANSCSWVQASSASFCCSTDDEIILKSLLSAFFDAHLNRIS